MAFRNAKFPEQMLCLWSPKQARQDEWINALVCPLGPNAAKPYALRCTSLGDHNAPPVGHHRHGWFEMLGRDDQQGLVDNLAVSCDLPGQAQQAIGLGLDLNTANVAIDHRNIDPATAVVEAEFINDQCVGTGLRVRKQPPVGGLPYVTVTKRFQSHVESIAAGTPLMQRPIVRSASLCPHWGRARSRLTLDGSFDWWPRGRAVIASTDAHPSVRSSVAIRLIVVTESLRAASSALIAAVIRPHRVACDRLFSNFRDRIDVVWQIAILEPF